MIGLHMLNPSGATSGAGSANRHQRQPYDNIIRVSAKTAPQIVSSVPKCRNTKTSRSHPLDTINGAAVNQQPLEEGAQNRSLMSDHKMLQQRQRHSQREQMVLIVSDDNRTEPIIGRRLPSKSAGGSMGQHRQVGYAQQAPLEATAGLHLHHHDDPMSSGQGPVLGRRTNRLMQQQQRQQVYHAGEAHYAGADSADPHHLMPPGGGRRATSGHEPYSLQQPLSVVETQAPMSQRATRQQRPPKAVPGGGAKSRSKSGHKSLVMAEVEYSHSAHMTSAQATGYKVAPAAATNAGRRLVRSAAMGSPAGTPSSPLACPPGCPCGAYPEARDFELNPTQLGMGCDCYECQQLDYPVAAAQSRAAPINRSASCLRIPACCRPDRANKFDGPPPAPEVYHRLPYVDGSRAAHYGHEEAPSHQLPIDYHHHHHHNHHHHHQQQHTPGGSQRQARPLVSHHHQQGANGAGRCPPASHRSASCHEPRPRHQPLLISGRNPLPVHPKPVINFSPHLTSGPTSMASPIEPESLSRSSQQRANNRRPAAAYQSPDSSSGAGGSEPDAGVSQMYESLAAELKAKLGDPKMGPILLPPRDYDTMSRKQGKLTGIELRRSTNPQLVGPTANRLPSAATGAGRETTIEEEQPSGGGMRRKEASSLSAGHMNPKTLEQQVPQGGCGSSRSSGRSTTNGDDDRGSLQRSRSNSSSGLGSISMGAGSPNSSPSSKSSSSEDMRQQPLHLRHCLSGQAPRGTNYTKTITITSGGQPASLLHNKTTLGTNSSPDCCGASDSGHSEGGPMEDRLRQHRFRGAPGSDTQNCSSNSTTGANNKQQTTTGGRLMSEARTGQSSHGGVLSNGRVEVPLKVNSNRNSGNTYLATKQIIY